MDVESFASVLVVDSAALLLWWDENFLDYYICRKDDCVHNLI